MQLKDTRCTFGCVTRSLHWILVILVCFQPTYVFVNSFLETDSLQFKILMHTHQISGMVIFFLTLLFISWRLSHAGPRLPDTLKPIEKILANLVHGLLFFVLLAIPFTGYFVSLAMNFYVYWLGISNWSGLLAPNQSLADTWLNWHDYAIVLLVFLVGIHIAAVLKHQLILKDNTLYRMLPVAWFKQKSE